MWKRFLCAPVRHLYMIGGATLLLPTSWFPNLAYAKTPQLNDTGQSVCIDPKTAAPIDCVGSGQDGEFGRDITHPKNKDGAKGFQFMKIGPNGELLSSKAEAWTCVLDSTTGLTWEVKTDDGGARDVDNSYTNWGDDRLGDATLYIKDLNEAKLCGFQDWRLPTVTELYGLTYLGKPLSPIIDENWFPNTKDYWYWTETKLYDSQYQAWTIYFGGGQVYPGNQNTLLGVRAVRSDPK